MDRVKNGRYENMLGHTIEVTDAMQPLFVKKIVMNRYFSKKYIVLCENNLQLIIPHSALTESEYKKSWQNQFKERSIPCKMLTNEFGGANIPRKSNYNLEVKSYCKKMLGSGCPALINDYNADTYSCQYKKLKKSDYEAIVLFCKNEN